MNWALKRFQFSRRACVVNATAQCWTPVPNTFAVFNLPAGYAGYATVNILFAKVSVDGKFTAADYDNNFGLGPALTWDGVIFAASAEDAAIYVAGISRPSKPVLNCYGPVFSQLSGVWENDTDFFSLFGSLEGKNDYDGSGVSWDLAAIGQEYPYLPSCH